VPFPIFSGSRIIGQAADVLPVFDFPLHLVLDAWRFFRLPSATGVFDRSRQRSPPLSDGIRTSCQAFRSGSRSSFGSFVPALDSWTKFPLSRECLPLSQAGGVTLRFRLGSLVFDRSR